MLKQLVTGNAPDFFRMLFGQALSQVPVEIFHFFMNAYMIFIKCGGEASESDDIQPQEMLKREESAEKYPELQNKYGTREFLCRGEGIKWIQQEEYEKI